MAIYDYTRQQLRHLVARLVDDLLIGTVTSPASGTFVIEETDWERPNDHFNEWLEMFCYSGTAVGTSGKPTAWVNTTHTLTFLPAATLTVSDLVEMHERFTVNQYNDFINLAIEAVAKIALVDKVDESIDLATDTYQYTLPTQFLYIRAIYLESATAGVYDMARPIDPKYWRVVKKSTLQLEFVKEWFKPTDGRALRITGWASPSKLDSDSEQCPINPNYVVQAALARLHQSRIRGPDKDSEFHAQQMGIAQSLADRIARNMRVNPIGVAVVEN